MSGSVKGRVLLRKDARDAAQVVKTRLGICEWCGESVRAPKDVNLPCPRCHSTEVLWPDPPPPPVEMPKPRYTRDESFLPGEVALSVLGGRVIRRT